MVVIDMQDVRCRCDEGRWSGRLTLPCEICGEERCTRQRLHPEQSFVLRVVVRRFQRTRHRVGEENVGGRRQCHESSAHKETRQREQRRRIQQRGWSRA